MPRVFYIRTYRDAKNCNLINAYTTVNHITSPETYIKNSKQIKYIFVSRGIIPAILIFKTMLFSWKSFANNWAVYINFSLCNLSGGPTSNLPLALGQQHQSFNLHNRRRYSQKLFEYMREHNMSTWAQKLRHFLNDKQKQV